MITKFSSLNKSALSLCFKVGGSVRRVKFTSPVVFGHMNYSTFTTGDDALAKAMKESPMCGNYYRLEAEYDNTPAVEATIATNKEEVEVIPENATIVESVTTKGMAVAYIQGVYGETFTATTVEEMKREALQKWNVVFPKWGKTNA